MSAVSTNRRFGVGLAVALVAGLGLPFGVNQLVAAARKDAIDIRVPLERMTDDGLPSFRLRRDLQFETLGPEWVGTSEMIILPVEPTNEPFPGRFDAAGLPTLFVTYYSDPDETIPHTPEVCYDQAGATIRSVRLVPITVPGRDDNPEQAKRLLIERGDDRRIVMYVLYHNGKVLDDRSQVRLAMALPGADHTYFAKIEAVQTIYDDIDEATAEGIATTLLEEAIAMVAERHLPRDAELVDAD